MFKIYTKSIKLCALFFKFTLKSIAAFLKLKHAESHRLSHECDSVYKLTTNSNSCEPYTRPVLVIMDTP
jgi:hypothetical protein